MKDLSSPDPKQQALSSEEEQRLLDTKQASAPAFSMQERISIFQYPQNGSYKDSDPATPTEGSMHTKP